MEREDKSLLIAYNRPILLRAIKESYLRLEHDYIDPTKTEIDRDEGGLYFNLYKIKYWN